MTPIFKTKNYKSRAQHTRKSSVAEQLKDKDMPQPVQLKVSLKDDATKAKEKPEKVKNPGG